MLSVASCVVFTSVGLDYKKFKCCDLFLVRLMILAVSSV